MTNTGTIHDVLADINELNRNLTDRYPLRDGFPVFKELVQNADDAGASNLRISWHRGFPQSAHQLLQGPALLLLNDGRTCGQDLLNIRRLGVNYKAVERGVIGRFGLGLKSVFHLCEAFFYLAFDPESDEVALQQRPKGHLYNPWNGGSEGNRYHSDWDDVGEEQFALIADAFAPMTPDSRWFGLWIPLRQSSHGSDPIIGQYFGDTGDSKAEYVPDHLAARLARLLPVLTTLKTIEIRHIRSSDSIDQVERVTVHPGAVRLERDISKIGATPRSFFGSIEVFSSKSQSKATLRWYGQECCLDSENVSDLTASPHWPKSRSRNHWSGQPQTIDAPKDAHCAVVLIEPENAANTLSIRHACYLPLNMVHEESGQFLSIDELLLHARFFVDAGRQEVKGFSVDHKTEIPQNDEQLRAAWNRRLFERGTTRLLLPTVCDWAEASSIDDTRLRALTRVLQKCRFVQEWRDSICGEWQWLYRLEVNDRGDSLSGRFQCVETDVPILTIPPAKNDVPLLKLCPGLAHYLKSHALLYSDWPRLTSVDDPEGWPSSLLRRLIKSIDPTIAFACADNLQYLADFLEHCASSEDQRRAAGEAIWLVLKRAFQSASVDLLTIQQLAEPLRRVLDFVPVEHRLILSWAAVDREGAAEAFRLVASDGYDVLPIPVSVRPTGGDRRKISSEATIRILRGVEQLSLKSDLLADVVGDVLNRADKDRQELSNQLATLRLLVVHNGLSKQTERVTWGMFEKQKSKRLAFCDQAGLTKQLQSAIGDAGSVWRIDPAFAEKVLGKEHGVPGCSARECVALLTPDRDGRLSRFAPRQSLSDWPERVELLTKLIEQSERGNSDGQEKTRDACRFLMHGRIQDAGFNDPLFIAKAGESDPLAEKLARHVLIRPVDPDTRSTEGWRILGGDAATWAMESLTVSQRRQLKLIPLKLSEPELIELLQRARPDQLAGLDVTEDEYAHLLETFTEQTPDLMKRLPVHATIDGRRVAIESNSNSPLYWNDGYELDGELQHSAVLLRMHKEKKVKELQARLADVLGPQQAVELILKSATPEKYWKSILKAIEKSNAPFAEEVLKALQLKRWFPTRHGARSSEDLICLTIGSVNGDFSDTFISEINRIVEVCSAAYVPDWLLDNQLQKTLQANSAVVAKRLQVWKILPIVDESLGRLGKLLATSTDSRIGPISSLEDFDVWLANAWLSELNPVHRLLTRLSAHEKIGPENCFEHVAKELTGDLNTERLLDILRRFAETIPDGTQRRKQHRRLFSRYLEAAVTAPDWSDERLPELRLPTATDDCWQAPQKLCRPAPEIDPRDQVHQDIYPVLTRPGSLDHAEAKAAQPSSNHRQIGDKSIDDDAFRTTADGLRDYFKEWEPHIRPALIGIFLSLLGDDNRLRSLAEGFLRPRTLHSTRRELGIGTGQENDSIPRSGVGERYRMNRQRVVVVIESGEQARRANLLGHMIDVRRVSRPTQLLGTTGGHNDRVVEVIEREDCRILQLRIQAVTPTELSGTELVHLLREASERFMVDAFGYADEAHGKRIERLFETYDVNTGQLQICIAQRMILEDAVLSLEQLGLGNDEVFATILEQLHEHRITLGEREEINQRTGVPAHGDYLEDAKWQRFGQAIEELRRVLANSEDETAIKLLTAIRRQVGDHNGYEPSSVPFELFQNADDACVEQERDFGTPDVPFEFELAIGSGYVAIRHNGRQINRAPSREAAKARRYDDLRRMLTLWLSGKLRTDASDHSEETGKYGLGFKSVFLVSDEPYIVSGDIACRIVGGCYPDSLLHDDQGRQILEKAFGDEQPEYATSIGLPLRQGVVADKIVRRFLELAHVLVIFARRIHSLRVHTLENDRAKDRRVEWSPTEDRESLPGVRVGQLPDVDGSARTAIVLFADTSSDATAADGALLLVHDGKRFVAEKTLPTFWVTAPTQHDVRLGFVINADFDLDTGRANLAQSSKDGKDESRNGRLARKLGTGFGKRLRELYEASLNWNAFCKVLRLQENAQPYDLWESLWQVFVDAFQSNASIDAPSQVRGYSHAIELAGKIIWGDDGAAPRLYRECPVLPGRLKEASFRNELSTLSQIRFAVKGILANDDGYGLMCVRDWPAFKKRLGDGHVTSERIASQLRTLLDHPPSGAQKVYELTDLLAWEISDQCVAPEDARRFGEVFVGDALQKCDRGEEERLLTLLHGLQFKNRKGDFVPVGKLIVGHQPQGAPSDARSDERMRAMFAPEDRVLSGEYSAVGLAFFDICRERLNAPASELAEWVLRASTKETRDAAVFYLADGDLRREVQAEIHHRPGGIAGTWLESFTKSNEFREMTPTQQGQLVGLLPGQQGQRVIDVIVKNAEQGSHATHANPAEVLIRIHRWWTEKGDNFTRDYECRTYPSGGLQHLTGDRDDRFRKDWVVLFLLGQTHTMGRAIAEQHRELLRKCDRDGRLDMFASSERDPAQWMSWINEFLDSPQDDAQFLQWMKQFVGIYQVSRHLDVYIHAFEAVERFDRQFTLREITWLSRSPEFQGGGIDAPQLTRVLGMGQCFVLRELVRKGIITNAKAHQHCYVPVKRVRDLLAYLGCRGLGQTSQKWDLSRDIHRFLCDQLGVEASHFGLAFDIPLQIIAENDELQSELFNTRIRFDDSDDDFWYSSDETAPE
jgi:hypothetical protein